MGMVLSSMVRLESGQVELRNEVALIRIDIMMRLDRHENHLSDIRDDIAASMDCAD